MNSILSDIFSYTLRFDLLSLNNTRLLNNDITSPVFIHVFYLNMVTSKLILQIISHNSAQLLTIIHNIVFTIAHNIFTHVKWP